MAIDIKSAFPHEPPPLDFVWSGFLSGTIGACVAPGGSGKSFWALQAAMSVAGAGTPGTDLLDLRPARGGRVLYIASEDPQIVLQHRVHAIGRLLSQSARDAIAANLTIECVTAFDIPRQLEQIREFEVALRKWRESDKKGEMPDADALPPLDKMLSGHKYRLIILDTISRMHTLDENSNSDMARLLNGLEQMVSSDGVAPGAAVLYLHHISKASSRDAQGDQQQAARGASALIDNARWGGFLSTMTRSESEKYSDGEGLIGDRRRLFVRVGTSKINYGSGGEINDKWYKRCDGGVLLPVKLDEVKHEEKGGNGEKGRFRDGF